MHRAILVCLLTCAGLHAQTDSASVRILATDASGLAIADPPVALINTATGVKLARTTAADGYAMFTPVPPGRYSVEVSKAGFQQTRVTDVALDVAERKLVRVAMSVAAVTS